VNVLYWGSPPFSIPPLEALLGSGHRVVGLVTREDRPAGRGRRLRPTPAKTLALERGLPVLQPSKTADPDFLRAARDLRPDISVVAAYGKILKPEPLELPPRGSICIHPSLLPLYRGASPIQRAILAGVDTYAAFDPAPLRSGVFPETRGCLGGCEQIGVTAGLSCAAQWCYQEPVVFKPS